LNSYFVILQVDFMSHRKQILYHLQVVDENLDESQDLSEYSC